MTTVKFEGGDKVARELSALSTRVSRQIQREALKEAAELIRSRASSNAPRDPGNPDLAENIVISNANPGGGTVGVVVGPSVPFFYGIFQEFGTSRHGAQPFLRPAFDTEIGRVLGEVKGALWSALIRRGAGSGRGGGGGTGV